MATGPSRKRSLGYFAITGFVVVIWLASIPLNKLEAIVRKASGAAENATETFGGSYV